MIKPILIKNQGLTLVELMIVLGLSVLLMSAAYLSYNAQFKGGRVQEQVAVIQQDLRAVMDMMEKDIRNAGCDPTMADITPLLAGTSGVQTLAVQMDLTGSGTATKTWYTWNSMGLYRNGQELAQNVTSFGLTYWDEDAAAVTPTSAANASYGVGNTLTATQVETVRSVDVTVTIRSAQRDPDTGEYLTRTTTRRVRMRNE